MKQVWRNLKGEVVRTVGREEEPLWRFSRSTWLLILGLILFNAGCFLRPSLLDTFLDVRLWPWWAIPGAVVLLIFCVFWFLIALRWENRDERQQERAVRFLRFSIYLSVSFFLVLLVHSTLAARQAAHYLERMFCYGEFSLGAFGCFLLLVLWFIPACYFIKEWIVSILGDR